MPDLGTIAGVAAADVGTIGGVAKANISTVAGLSVPTAGATLWCLAGADGAIGTAAASDLNAWTCYVSGSMGTKDYNSIAYGKDGNGAGLWCAVNANGSREIRYSSDPTNTTGWSDINPLVTMLGVAWSNDVWIAVGGQGKVYRSTAGTTGWSLLDLSGVAGWVSDVSIYEVVGNGAGEFMFAQGMNVFHSSDDGTSWTRVLDASDANGLNLSGYTAYTMAYNKTQSRWIVFMRKTSQSRVFYAAAGATGTWTAATVGGNAQSGQTLINAGARRMASGGNTVIIVHSNDTSRSTNGGADWTKNSNDLPRTDARDIATDGAGNWVCVHDSGRVSISTNDGVTWAEQTGFQQGQNTNMRFPTGGNNVENLDSVAADVLLPV